MFGHVRQILRITIGATLVLAATAAAADWPCWRGPNHDGLSPEKGFEPKWDAAPPKVWEADIGSAFSGLTVVAGKVYTCGTQNKQQTLFCLAADTGKIIWQTPIEEEYPERQGGDGTRGTPAFNDGRVYIQGALGRVLCCDAETGKEIWSRQYEAKPQWGYAASVLIDGDLALVTAGGKDGALVALDKQTGKVVWQCGRDPVGYATPYPFTFENQRYIVGFMGKEVIIADAKTGQQVWSMPWQTDWDVNASTPIYHDGHLFLSSGYDHGSILLKLARDGEQLKTETVWQNKSIRAKFQSPVLYDGHLYASDEVGLSCVAFATGETKWNQRGVTNGTLLIADGHVLLLTEKGELQIAPASPRAFEPRTTVPLLKGRCWTVPTLWNGHLYARNFKQVACYKLTK
jgi:outer membrane protein assembly factor BamB